MDIGTDKSSISDLAQENEQLKKAKEDLADAQIFLDSIIENIPNMIFVKDAKDLKFLRFNKAGEHLIGKTREDLVGRNDYDLFDKEQADHFTETDRKVLSNHEVFEIQEEPIETPRGKRFLHTKKIPIFDCSNRPLYLLGISEDITERKEAERQKLELFQVQTEKEQAELISNKLKCLSNATEALSQSLDLGQMVHSFSKMLTQDMYSVCVLDLFDWSNKSIERTISVRGQMDLKKIQMSLLESLDEKTKIFDDVNKQDMLEVLKDENLVDQMAGEGVYSLTVVPLILQDRIIGRMVLGNKNKDKLWSTLDFSFAEDLGRRASLAFENARLFLAAKEASRAKSSFLANISHEIRNPLGAMLGFGEVLLEDKGLRPDQRSHIATIVRNANQLLRIVDEVLDLSKVESDRIEIEKIDFSLKSLLEDVMSLLRVKAVKKGLDFNLELSESVPELIKSDPYRIRQILLNLIGNSIKFTLKGHVSLQVKFEAGPSPSVGRLQFRVSDSGIGMSLVQINRIFKPYLQAENSTARRFGGTGLGLFFAKKLANLLGGEISLESSELGKGSCFRFSLDVEVSEEKDPVEVIEDLRFIESYEKFLIEGKRRKILVVDDSLDNQILIKTLLGKTGLDVNAVDNGIEGVRSALWGSYHLILMDIQMPEMDGFQAVAELRKNGYRGRVVALTARAMKGDRELCLNQGFETIFVNPSPECLYIGV